MNYKKKYLKYKLKYLNAKKLYGGMEGDDGMRDRSNAFWLKEGDLLSSFMAGLSLESPSSSNEALSSNEDSSMDSLENPPTRMNETPSQQEVSFRQLPRILFEPVVKAIVSAKSEQDQDMAPPPEVVAVPVDEDTAEGNMDEEDTAEGNMDEEDTGEGNMDEEDTGSPPGVVGNKRPRSNRSPGSKQSTPPPKRHDHNQGNKRGPNKDPCYSPVTPVEKKRSGDK